MMKNYLFIALSFFITNISYASEEIIHQQNNCVSSFQKGSLKVQYDQCTNTFQVFTEKIIKSIDDKGMLHFKRELIKQENANAQNIYWDLYEAYWLNQEKESNENEN